MELLAEVVEEEVQVDIEEQIQFFPGYENPFWYQKKKDKLYWQAREIDARIRLEEEKKRPNPTFAGTQPDIEIRWFNDHRRFKPKAVSRSRSRTFRSTLHTSN